MKFKKPSSSLIFWSGIFVAVLGFYMSTLNRHQGYTTVDLPSLPQITAAEMERIEVDRPQGRLVLAKKNSLWQMEAPVTFPASQTRMDNIMRVISDARVTDMIAEKTDAEADFGLNSPAAMVIRVQGTAGKELKLVLGRLNQSSSHTFAQLPNDPRVYQVLGDWITPLNVPALEWRSLQIFDFSTDVIRRVVKTQGRQILEIFRAEEPVPELAVSAKGNTAAPRPSRSVWKAVGEAQNLSDMKVNQWLNAFSRLSATRIIDPPAVAGKPLAILACKTLNAEYTLEILEFRSKEKVYWVRPAGGKVIYEIQEYQGQNLLKDRKDLL